jgi:hypothetical protein
MIAGFPATPLALSTAPCPMPDPKEPPKTRSLALLSSQELDRHRATSGMRGRLLKSVRQCRR